MYLEDFHLEANQAKINVLKWYYFSLTIIEMCEGFLWLRKQFVQLKSEKTQAHLELLTFYPFPRDWKDHNALLQDIYWECNPQRKKVGFFALQYSFTSFIAWNGQLLCNKKGSLL